MPFRILIFICSIAPHATFAQADFARQFMSSGLYEVRKVPPATPVKRKPANEEENVKAAPVTESGAKVTTKVEPAVQPAEEQPIILARPSDSAKVIEVEEPGLSDQVRSLIGSSGENVIEKYEERVHPEDQRLNRLEIEGRAGFSSVDSSSNYSFRRYNSSFGTIDLRSSVWMAPSLGVTGALRFSLGASVRGDEATGSMDRLRDEEIAAGFRFRRYFGISRMSSSVEFDLLYLSHTFNVAMESVAHPRWVSSGVGFGLQTRFPVSAERAWTFSGRVFPRLKHVESKAAVDVSSGNEGDHVRLDLEAGGDISFGRGNQIVYGMQVGAERNLFDGSASLADPQTGKTPSNVTVTNTLLNFSFGYRWGR